MVMDIYTAFKAIGFSTPVDPPRPRVKRRDPLYDIPEHHFSREHAGCSTAGHCWICLFPLGTKKLNSDLAPSQDHVIPLSRGGEKGPRNVRLAHRWCNTAKSNAFLTKHLVHACRAHMVAEHGKWLATANVLPHSGMRIVIYPDVANSYCHERAFECRSGAD